MADLYDELEFPPRAERLDQYQNYQVDIAHWKQLAAQFQKAFRQVHARRGAAVLLVHGPQGSGKSMFCKRLEQDYKRGRDGAVAPDLRNNLWHVLVTTDKRNDEETIRSATAETRLTLVDDRKADWLQEPSLSRLPAKDFLIFCRRSRSRSRSRKRTGTGTGTGKRR